MKGEFDFFNIHTGFSLFFEEPEDTDATVSILTEVNSFSGSLAARPTLIDNLATQYGVAITRENWQNMAEVSAYIADSLAAQIPVVVSFSQGFMNHSPLYGKTNLRHVIIIRGYNEKKRLLHCIDHSHSPVFDIPLDVFISGGERLIDVYGTFVTYGLGSTGNSYCYDPLLLNTLEQQQTVEQYEDNISRLFTFILAGDKGVAVPNNWQLTNEKLLTLRWLNYVAKNNGLTRHQLNLCKQAMIKSSNNWYTIEKKLVLGVSGKELQGFLDQVKRDEIQHIQIWLSCLKALKVLV
jgi:hypothetical protein